MHKNGGTMTETGPEKEGTYFKRALWDFAFDAACGGAIRHLADLSYSCSEIVETLDYPVPLERVRREVRRYFYDQKLLLTKAEFESGDYKEKTSYHFEKRQGKNGKITFVKVADDPSENSGQFSYGEKDYRCLQMRNGKLSIDGMISEKQQKVFTELLEDGIYYAYKSLLEESS